MKKALWIIVIAAFFSGTTAFAQELGGAIDGTVTTADDGPHSGAKITASSPDGAALAKTKTNDLGYFRVPGLPVYWVMVKPSS